MEKKETLLEVMNYEEAKDAKIQLRWREDEAQLLLRIHQLEVKSSNGEGRFRNLDTSQAVKTIIIFRVRFKQLLFSMLFKCLIVSNIIN